MESVFHDAIEFSPEKLGNPDCELKTEQYDAIRAVCVEEKDVLTVLPTGFGKSVIYQVLPSMFDFLRSAGEPEQQNLVVIVVSPLNALMRDQYAEAEELC